MKTVRATIIMRILNRTLSSFDVTFWCSIRFCNRTDSRKQPYFMLNYGNAQPYYSHTHIHNHIDICAAFKRDIVYFMRNFPCYFPNNGKYMKWTKIDEMRFTLKGEWTERKEIVILLYHQLFVLFIRKKIIFDTHISEFTQQRFTRYYINR